MKIVIGFDGSPESAFILSDLQRAGIPAGSSFLIVASTDMEPIAFDLVPEPVASGMQSNEQEAWQSQLPTGERNYLAQMVRGARLYAAERQRQVKKYTVPAMEKLKGLFPKANVVYEIVNDCPSYAIIDQAQEFAADLIVVGSHSPLNFGRLFLGSVSQSVVLGAFCSVRICRKAARQNLGAPRVIVGFDGSPTSRAAIESIAERDWPIGTQARVVTILEPRSMSYFASKFHHLLGEEPGLENELEEVPDLLTNVAEIGCRRLQQAGLFAQPFGLHGDPKEVLLEMADEWNADSIFIGATGQREQRTSKSLGSVANLIAHRAKCSVEIVRRVATKPEVR
jgi:nucleotide-binding universal stress UspA family protein